MPSRVISLGLAFKKASCFGSYLPFRLGLAAPARAVRYLNQKYFVSYSSLMHECYFNPELG